MIDRLRVHAPAVGVLLMLVLVQLAPGCGGKGDGTVDGEVTVESQERGQWALFSFDEGALGTTDDPSSEEGWDLAISQWVIATNSGAAASADSVSRGALLATEGLTDDWPDLAAFDARCSEFGEAGETQNTGAFGCGGATPTVDEGWVPDLLDDPDGAGPFGEVAYNPSVTFWFEYNFSGHEVFPYGNIYVVEAHDGRCAKLQVTDYYDEDGESGFVSFSWEFLPD